MSVPAISRLRVAVVAPTLEILGGQSVQADHLLAAWRDDPAVDAWLVPVNPNPPWPIRPAVRVKYARTAATQLAYWPRLVRELARADLVHVFSASYLSFLLAPLPAMLVARALGRPILLNYHSGEAPDHLRRSAVARLALARVDRNVVPSGFLRDVFASFGIEAAVIPNIIDAKRVRFRERQRLAPRLVSTRNFERLYNVACTLRAFRIVQDRYPLATLTLVGDGRERSSLEQLGRDLALRNVTFAGRVDPSRISQYYEDADIYIQTPDIDNTPLSVLEAYASGLPVVSTNAGGVPYILEHERQGLLANTQDAAGVAAAVVRLLEEPALASLVIEGGRRQAERCTWPQVRDRWLEVYRGLASPTSVNAHAVEYLR